MSIARGSGNVGSLDAREFDPVLVGSEAAIVGTIARNAMMPKMAAVVRVEFELKEGVPVDTATTALVGGIGAMKLAIERADHQNRSDRRRPGFGSGQYCRAERQLIGGRLPAVRRERYRTLSFWASDWLGQPVTHNLSAVFAGTIAQLRPFSECAGGFWVVLGSAPLGSPHGAKFGVLPTLLAAYTAH